MGTNSVNPYTSAQQSSEDFCPEVATQAIPTSDPDDFDLVSRLDFESGSISDLMSLWKSSWLIGKNHLFQIATDPDVVSNSTGQNPNHVARFEVHEGDYAGDFDRIPNEDGILRSRSELRERFAAQMGETYWYSFRTFIPEDFPIEDNRLIIAQWHASDSNGEATSPPLSVRYRNGTLSMTAIHSDRRKQLSDSDVTRVKLYSQENFPRGQWHDFVFQVKWSYDSDGFVNAWVDGQQVVQYQGGVGYKDKEGPYFKFGAYRDEEYIVEDENGTRTKIKATDPYVIYHDDYLRAKSCTNIF